MKTTVGCMLAALVALFAVEARAKRPLVGKWELVRMSRGTQSKKITDRYMSLQFKKGGGFVTVMRFRGRSIRDAGTWSVKGNTLTTKTPKHTQVVTFKIAGAELQLTRPNTNMSMHLRRAK